MLVAFWRHRLEAVSSAVQAKAANGFSDICLLAVWLMLLRDGEGGAEINMMLALGALAGKSAQLGLHLWA